MRLRRVLAIALLLTPIAQICGAEDAELRPGMPGFIAWFTANHQGERAPPGYQYEAGSRVISPIDPCWREEMVSAAALEKVNASVSKPDGAPMRAVQLVDMFSPDLGALSGWGIRPKYAGASAISCHVTLVTADGGLIGGMLTFYDPGQYAPLQVAWISDRALAAQIARYDGLATARNLYFKPDLVTPGTQECVGRAAAKGRYEAFAGQLWAACKAEAAP
jgi:hypothetical protein